LRQEQNKTETAAEASLTAVKNGIAGKKSTEENDQAASDREHPGKLNMQSGANALLKNENGEESKTSEKRRLQQKQNPRNRVQIQAKIKIKEGKNNTWVTKIGFFIENQQEYNRSTDVTILPPLLDYWNKNIVIDTLILN
jgi:hypothetical protein